MSVAHGVLLGVLAALAVAGLVAVLAVARAGTRRLERRGGLLELDTPAARTALRPISWTCMVCGRQRADSNIAVASRQAGWLTINVRYCVDNDDCRKAAEARADADVRRFGPDEART